MSNKEAVATRKYYLYGLDISLKNTGVAIFDLEDKEFVYIGSFSTERIHNTKEYKNLDKNSLKLAKLSEWFENLIKEYPPYFASIEQMIKKNHKDYGVNIDELKGIAKATGVIQRSLWDVPQAFHYPSSVKLAIIRGDASKELVRSEILRRYPDMVFDNLDESDAVAVALTHLIEIGIVNWIKPDTPPKAKKPKKPKKTS